MKGPSGRIKHQAKRLWRCPHCQRTLLTAGSVTSQSCVCRPGETAWMRLEADHRSPHDVSAPRPPDVA